MRYTRSVNPKATGARSRADWLVAASVAGVLAWLATLSHTDPDTWWHLKTGELIWETKSIPRVDDYSYVIRGREWITFEWLAQLLYYGVHSLGGPALLSAFNSAIVVASYLLLLPLSGAAAAPLLVYGALTSRWVFHTRPHVFDGLIVALLLRLIDRSGERPARALWVWLPVSTALWANLHGGAAVVAPGLVGLRAVAELLKARDEAARRRARLWVLLSSACGAAILLNPHGWRLFPHLLGQLSFPAKHLISEWTPPVPDAPTMVFFALGLAAVAARFRREPFLSLVVAAFGAAAMSSQRHLMLFRPVAALLAGRALSPWLLARLSPAKLAGVASAAILAGSAAFAGLNSRYGEETGAGLEELPEAAVRFLDENGVEGRMFHSYDLGGYLIWKCYPKRRVFIDGRSLEYGPAHIAATSRWWAPGVFSELDFEWRFDYALIYNSSHYAARVFDDSPDWALVFWDDAAMVYLRRTPANAALIRRFAYALVRPNVQDFGYLLPRIKEARGSAALLAEAERALRGSQRNVNAAQLKAFVLGESGRSAEAAKLLEDAALRFPRKPGPLLALGWTYERANELLRARGAYLDAAGRASRAGDFMTQSFALNNLGSVEMKLGDLRSAERRFRSALRVFPKHPVAGRNLDRVRSQLRR